jgi:hypothetical protein
VTTSITRADLESLKGITPKLVRFFVDLFSDNADTARVASGAAATAAGAATVAGQAVASTGAIQNATVLTLSNNAAFNNERVLTAGDGISFTDSGPNGTLVIANSTTNPITVVGAFDFTLRIGADTDLTLPATGTLAALDLGAAYTDDAGATAGGVAVGQMYKRTDGLIAWRQV